MHLIFGKLLTKRLTDSWIDIQIEDMLIKTYTPIARSVRHHYSTQEKCQEIFLTPSIDPSSTILNWPVIRNKDK